MSLENRVALVTGASRGIGKGIALALAAEGAKIILAYRANRTAAQNAMKQIQARGVDVLAVQADVTVPEKAQALVEAGIERFGRIDALVNNVGDFRWKPVAETTVEEWHALIASNLLSVFYMCRQVLPQMRRQRWGRIVNMGSAGADRAFGQGKLSAYSAAKAAVVAFTRSLAVEEARHGITVNVVSPSIIDDKEMTVAEAQRVRDPRFPIGRPPTIEDIAAAVRFFVSEESGYITGQVLAVSGGWML